ncbi:MAG: hypothetical protein LQ350_003880 [Teloschistes chrysophthalmus]|nr:MAG: hypothetical protein LQ350_003880 [Niorma chrysophthalma]
MSYSDGYSNYSQYFRQATGPGEAGQNSYQNTANTNGRFPSQVYSTTTQINQQQSPSTYAPQQQQQQASFAPAASTVDRSSASHDRYGDGSTAGQYQDSRGGYGFTARPSNDTTALGNSPHASTLGDSSRSSAGTKENASLQQIINYNRSRGSYGYGGSIAYDTAATGYNYNHGRSDSRGTAASGDAQTQRAAQNQPAHYATTAGYGNHMPAQSTSQGAPRTTNLTTSYQYHSQPGRSAVNARSSHPAQQVSQSPTLPAHRTNPSKSVRSTQRPEQTQARVSPLPDSAKQVSSASPAPTQEKRHHYSTSTPSNDHVRQQSFSVPASGAQQTPAPKTVDPSHVFKNVEFQRRQAAAAEAAAMKKAAEAAKKAAEVAETRKATEAATALKRVSESSQPWSNGTSREEEMAADMRLMIEKMRDYKSEDPSIFSQAWEQVKKTQPAGTLSAIPPLSTKDITIPTSSVPTSNLVDDRTTNGMQSTTQRRNPKSKGLPEKSDSSSRVSQKVQTTPTFTLTKAVNLDRQVVYTSGAGPEVRNPPSNHTPTPASASSFGPPAPPAPIQAPPVHAYGNTFWPEHKKWDLAVAAQDTLLSDPANANKAEDISAEQILGLLNQNPSYPQLCRMIEAKGFVLEPRHFARSLLNAIPNGEAGLREKQQNAVPHTHPRPPINTPQPNGAPTHAPVAQMTPPQPPKTEETPTIPLTKQEMARKRTMAEIVELSDDDDTDLPPPPKLPRLDGPTLPSSQNQHVQSQPFQQQGMPLWSYGPPSFRSHGYHPLPSSQKPQPPTQSTSAQALSQELINSEGIVSPLDKRKVRARTKYNPATIVRDVLLAARRHPTMKPLNYHLENLRDTFKHVNDLSDLSTFRWDLVDPGEPVVAAAAERRITAITDGNKAGDEDVQELVSQTAARTDQDVAENPRPSPKLSGARHGSTPRQPVTTPTSTATASSGTTSPAKKRGRPPGAKNRHSRNSTGTPTTQPSSMTRPRRDTAPARPSGLRNTVNLSSGIAVVIPLAKTLQQTSPTYRVYKCKWENCPAELHNLETLKKHVLKHGEKYAEGRPIPCLWKGCGQAATTKDEETMDVHVLEFGTYEIWAKHVNTRHIIDDAWRLGDGPSNRSDSEISDYVNDSAKRQVAPIIRNDGQARPDPLPVVGKPAKAYHKAHGITTESGKAKAFKEASERRKRYGPGIEPVGCTFVTDKKRALLKTEVGPLKVVRDGEW